MIAIVVAHSRNRVIGRDGGLPWHLPSDLERFRELTTGGTVVMGRRTWESLPERFRPLPNRRNVVVSRNGCDAPEVCRDADEALVGDCFVIGGGELYGHALARADRVYATEIESVIDGDAFFPELAAGEWRCVERSDPIAENGHVYTFATYDRA